MKIKPGPVGLKAERENHPGPTSSQARRSGDGPVTDRLRYILTARIDHRRNRWLRDRRVPNQGSGMCSPWGQNVDLVWTGGGVVVTEPWSSKHKAPSG
jgi:hypothetical protein